METKTETWICPACNKEVTELIETISLSGVCTLCEAKDIWMDPVGGIHYGNDGDPAAMYE